VAIFIKLSPAFIEIATQFEVTQITRNDGGYLGDFPLKYNLKTLYLRHK
jgi:hypothetical protein